MRPTTTTPWMTAFVVSAAVALALGSGLAADAGDIAWDKVLGADPDQLDSSQKAAAKQILEQQKVYYGCNGTIAECLGKDPASMTARRLAGMVVRKVKAGHSSEQIAKMIVDRGTSMHPIKTHSIDTDGAPRVGSDSPKVRVVVFADFECPYCRKVVPRLEKAATNLESVTLYFKHFPVKSHKKSVAVAVASLAAHAQGKFWPFHDLCYKDHKHIDEADLVAKAEEAGVGDMAKFKTQMKSKELVKKVEKDKLDGLKLGVNGTPTIFIDGKRYEGETTYADIKDVLSEELDLVAGMK